MISPFISTKEVARLAQVSTTTVNKWTCTNQKTGIKYKPGFPDQCHKGFYRTKDIEAYFSVTL